jgi:hypothetical protein
VLDTHSPLVCLSIAPLYGLRYSPASCRLPPSDIQDKPPTVQVGHYGRPTVTQSKDFDRGTQLLCQRPGLESLVRTKSFRLGMHEVRDRVAGSVVRESDKVPTPTLTVQATLRSTDVTQLKDFDRGHTQASALCFRLGMHEVRDRVAGSVVRESDKVPTPTLSSDGRRAPHVTVHLVTKTLCTRANADFRDGLTGGAGKQACLAVSLS